MTETTCCSVEQCGKRVLARGWCSMHYARWRKFGNPEQARAKPRLPDTKCSVDGCDRPGFCRTWCRNHYAKWVRNGDPNGLVREELYCAVEGCVRSATPVGMCDMHYQRVRVHGDPGPPWSHKGRGSINRDGYRKISVSGRKIFEHRHIMQLHLGRELLPTENVHHINGVRDDNRIENLELWSTSQPPGQRVEDKIAWAIEFLTQYAPGRIAR